MLKSQKLIQRFDINTYVFIRDTEKYRKKCFYRKLGDMYMYTCIEMRVYQCAFTYIG